MDKSALPIIVESDTSNLIKEHPASKEESRRGQKFFRSHKSLTHALPRIFFVVIGLVIITEVAIGVETIKNQPVIQGKTGPSFYVPEIALFLGSSPVTTSPKVGQQIPVQVQVWTGGEVLIGADVILEYDPRVLSVSRADITPGKIFDEYPALSVDPSTGVISMSGIAEYGTKGFIGKGVFATVNFTAKTTGTTTIKVDFVPGSTTHSNLVSESSQKNLLQEASNLPVTITK